MFGEHPWNVGIQVGSCDLPQAAKVDLAFRETLEQPIEMDVLRLKKAESWGSLLRCLKDGFYHSFSYLIFNDKFAQRDVQ